MRASPWRSILMFSLLALLTVAAYGPALNGQFIWDDEAHVTPTQLRSWYGLGQIWINPYATQQYYPMTHSAFWVQTMLWGDTPWPFHVVNLTQHLLAAGMLVIVLRKLKIPGAMLAAGLFAVHPVMVESVAWISELKNTQSTLFYLLALWCYLQFDPPSEPSPPPEVEAKRKPETSAEERRWGFYALAIFFFVLALLTKTVTASLPGAILVITWWKTGRLSFRRHILPVLPMFAIGMASGLFTAWVEVHLIGAKGQVFELNLWERVLLAARVTWFYLGKLAWPVDLMFSYPRWTIRAGDPVLYLYLLGLLTILIAAWRGRKRFSRAPLAVLLLYLGGLFPALGFFNVYPFIYSFVADHFQYLASLALCAGAAGGLTRWAQKWRLDRPATALPATGVLLLVLALLTWNQAHIYQNLDTLWTDTLKKNPDSSIAHNNYGVQLAADNRMDEAKHHFEQALRSDPSNVNAMANLSGIYSRRKDYTQAIHWLGQALKGNPYRATWQTGMGYALAQLGRTEDALAYFRNAIRLDPTNGAVYHDYGLALLDMHQTEKALEMLQKAVTLSPLAGAPRVGLSAVYETLGQLDQAETQARRAVALEPKLAEAHHQLGNILARSGNYAQAVPCYITAVTLRPDFAEAYNDLGSSLLKLGHADEARARFQTALEIRPELYDAQFNLALALASQGQTKPAIAQLERCRELKPQDPAVRRQLGAMLLLANQLPQAVTQLEAAVNLEPNHVDTRLNLAQALRETGQHNRALSQCLQAVKLDPNHAVARFMLGREHYTLQNFPEAVTQLKQAVTLKPDWIDAWDTLAAALARQGDFPQAVAAQQQALTLAQAQGQRELLPSLAGKLKAYQQGKRP